MRKLTFLVTTIILVSCSSDKENSEITSSNQETVSLTIDQQEHTIEDEVIKEYCNILKFEEKDDHVLLTIDEVSVYGESKAFGTPFYSSRKLGKKNS